MNSCSEALNDYSPAFADTEQPFITYIESPKGEPPLTKTFNRGQFWQLADRAAGVLQRAELGLGDRFLMGMGGNSPFDLAFRLGGTMTGTTPVTVNWQADTPETVSYKLKLTEAKLAVLDFRLRPELREHLETAHQDIPRFEIEQLPNEAFASGVQCRVPVNHGKIVIFTSGTTGKPKGVELPYSSYRTNQASFDQLLDIGSDPLTVFVVNPMHHTNSTAITDWAMRRPGAQIVLLDKYSTQYWRILVEQVEARAGRIVAPAVARHFDFLENLDAQGQLPVDCDALCNAMAKVDFLIGSAPVGPSTIERLGKYSGRIPTVRFGSTETCLQVIGIPYRMSEEQKLSAFTAGWDHSYKGVEQGGFYIGRPHPGHTEARVVRSITPTDGGYMEDCEEGEAGYLVTRGRNLMSGYVANPEATDDVFHQSWYTGLKDICFTLTGSDGRSDFYWMSRDNALMIRGGANYSYDQVNAELTQFVSSAYGIAADSFSLAVVGLNLESEHEDSCCVTIELTGADALAKRNELTASFLDRAKTAVSKGANPDVLRIGAIPRNFKGAILIRDLKAVMLDWLEQQA